MPKFNLILASTSPRRRELLSLLDIPFTTASADIDESILANESPTDYIQRMVKQKAETFIASLDAKADVEKVNVEIDSPLLILTADTIGVMPDGQSILLKPTDKADAFAMWRQMSANCHYVWTAVQATLVNTSIDASANKQILWQQQILETTKVQFVELTEEDMEAYWQTGEPADKAGGYAIQGRAGAWVSRIEGSYSNVVGFPLAQVRELIAIGVGKLD